MKALALRVGLMTTGMVWFLGAFLAWGLNAAGIPHAAIAVTWRMGLCLWLVLWYALTAPIPRRKRPSTAKPPEVSTPTPPGYS